MSGIIHWLESIQDAFAVDPSVAVDRIDGVRERFKIKQTDPMSVGRAVEGNRTATISRAQYGDVHMVIPMVSALDVPHTVRQAQPVSF